MAIHGSRRLVRTCLLASAAGVVGPRIGDDAPFGLVTSRPAVLRGDAAAACALCRAVAARWSARAPAVLLRRLFVLCLAAIALRLSRRG